ncbi:MAG TPA: hypothetical protein PKA38_02345 [Candidatus Levybacteria bacterium]|nr:hypothetical protein [Candidatus Levybacteria bacterium]
MPEDLHRTHLDKQRAAFKDAPYNRDAVILDEQNMFRAGNEPGSADVIAKREKVRILRLTDSWNSDLDMDWPEFPEGELLNDLTNFSLAFMKNGGFTLHHPDTIGITQVGSVLDKSEDNLGVLIPFAHNLELSFNYAFQDSTIATLEGLLLMDNNILRAQNRSEKGWDNDSLEIKFDKETGEAVLKGRGSSDLTEGDLTLEIGKEYDLVRNGRNMAVTVNSSSVEIVSYVPEEKDVDQRAVVPRTQPLEKVLDHNTEYVQRFTWEDKLIPDTLRRDPLQPYSDNLDNVWIRTDIPQLLGIKIQKNNPPLEKILNSSGSGSVDAE